MSNRISSKNFCIQNFKSLLFTATLAEFAEFAVHLSNNIVAGQFFGEEGISALHLVAPLLSFLLFITNMVCIGTQICYAFEIGRFDKDKAAKYFGQGVILTFFIGVFMALSSIIFRDQLINFLSDSHASNEYIYDYFKFLPIVILLQPFTLLMSQIVYIDGDKVVCAAAYICQIIGGIVISILLCGKLGISGISLGTVASFVLTLGILSLHFFKKTNTIKFKWYIDLRTLLHVAKYSSVKSSFVLFFSILTAIVNAFMVTHNKSSLLPVFAVIMDMVEFTVIFDGVEAAIAPMFTTLHAEHNNKMLRIVIKEAVKVAFTEGIVATVLVMCFAPQITQLFGLEDPQKAELAAHCLRIMSLSFCALSVTKLFAGYYLHLEHVILSIVICAIKGLIMPLLCIIVFVRIFGDLGLGIAFSVSPIVTFFAVVAIVYIIYKKELFPFLLKKDRDKDIHIYDIELSQQNIMDVVNKISSLLSENDINGKSSVWVCLFSEEVGMMILERNKNKKIYAQYNLDLNGDNINLIIRDSGEIFDITDVDSKISSLRSFIVSGIMENQEMKYYQITTGYNRNAFRFPKKA